jgi:hypothetical protein
MADQADRDPPATQGMRGEKSSAGSVGRPEFSHAVTLDNGKRVVVSEGNGVAYAEATGRVARPEPAAELEVSFTPEEPPVATAPSHASHKPMLIGALAVGAAAGVFLIERLRRASEKDQRPEHATGPLVPVRQLPHQQPFVAEISPSASQTSASSDRSLRSPDI